MRRHTAPASWAARRSHTVKELTILPCLTPIVHCTIAFSRAIQIDSAPPFLIWEIPVSTTQPSFQIPTEMRDFAEKSVEQARSAVTTFVQAARKGTETLQTSTKTAELPASVAFTRGLEFTEQNVTAAFELAQKLVRARDLQ